MYLCRFFYCITHLLVHYQGLISMTNDLPGAWRLSAVRSLKVVRISEVKMYAVNPAISRGHVACPLYGGCPLVGVSIIGGSTVFNITYTYHYATSLHTYHYPTSLHTHLHISLPHLPISLPHLPIYPSPHMRL